MNLLHLASVLALVAAAGHSFLSEKLFLRPLREEAPANGVFAYGPAKRLTIAMCHGASLCWIALAVSMLSLDPTTAGSRPTLLVYAGVFAISGLGNFWVVGRLHAGGVVLLSAAALTLAALYL